MGRRLGLGEGFASPLILSTLFKSAAFLAVLIALTIVEEIVIGVIHGRTVAGSLTELGGGTWQQIVATSVSLFRVLVPYFAFRALGELIGDDTLVRPYFEPSAGPPAPRVAAQHRATVPQGNGPLPPTPGARSQAHRARASFARSAQKSIKERQGGYGA
ncbi:MAG: hypothetical protein P4M07_28505 [Xanthobacteraceae bacterium]|nr:hypothetical protein [Xanthobacteraceae bacterium]